MPRPLTQLLTRFPRLPDFVRLARLDKPIGIWLLLWPTLWAVWIAAKGSPDPWIVVIFTAGVVLMRSAGCVINDWADRRLDGQVSRTRERPLVTGQISPTEALLFFLLLLGAAASLLLWLNRETLYWALGAAGLALLYPFMKRVTFLPQVVLGAAFSFGIPMAFVAQGQVPGPSCWLIFVGNLCWTVAYDTYYAMADRDDDIKAGIKSTALLFGELDLTIIASLQLIFLSAMWMLGVREQFGDLYTASLGVAVFILLLTWWMAGSRKPEHCLIAFRGNHWAGLAILIGIIGQTL